MMTERRRAAQRRNYLISRLRGVWALFSDVRCPEGKACQKLIDRILYRLDTEPETQRRDRFFRALEAEIPFIPAKSGEFQRANEIPAWPKEEQ